MSVCETIILDMLSEPDNKVVERLRGSEHFSNGILYLHSPEGMSPACDRLREEVDNIA